MASAEAGKCRAAGSRLAVPRCGNSRRLTGRPERGRSEGTIPAEESVPGRGYLTGQHGSLLARRLVMLLVGLRVRNHASQRTGHWAVAAMTSRSQRRRAKLRHTQARPVLAVLPARAASRARPAERWPPRSGSGRRPAARCAARSRRPPDARGRGTLALYSGAQPARGGLSDHSLGRDHIARRGGGSRRDRVCQAATHRCCSRRPAPPTPAAGGQRRGVAGERVRSTEHGGGGSGPEGHLGGLRRPRTRVVEDRDRPVQRAADRISPPPRPQFAATTLCTSFDASAVVTATSSASTTAVGRARRAASTPRRAMSADVDDVVRLEPSGAAEAARSAMMRSRNVAALR